MQELRRDPPYRFEDARRHGVDDDLRVGGQIAAAEVAEAVVDGERLARDDLVGAERLLDLEQEALLRGRLVHDLDDELKVGHQGLEVALQVRRRLYRIGASQEVLLDARVAAAAAIVVRADHTARRRREGEHGVAVLRHQIDADATRLRQNEGVVVGGMVGDDRRAAGVDGPRAGCREARTGNEHPEVSRRAAQARDREGEVGRSAPAASDGRRLDQVGAGLQRPLDARVESGGAVVVVVDAAAVCRHQVEEGVGLGRGQIDPHPAARGDREAVGVGVAA